MSELGTVLWITLIGMGLVFSAIAILWGLMVLLVRLAGRGEAQSGEAQEHQLAQQAAAIAVAVALAVDEKEREATNQGLPHEFPLPPTAVVSPWQAVTRSKMLDKRGPVR